MNSLSAASQRCPSTQDGKYCFRQPKLMSVIAFFANVKPDFGSIRLVVVIGHGVVGKRLVWECEFCFMPGACLGNGVSAMG